MVNSILESLFILQFPWFVFKDLNPSFIAVFLSSVLSNISCLLCYMIFSISSRLVSVSAGQKWLLKTDLISSFLCIFPLSHVSAIPLSTNLTKCSNTLKQFIGKFPTNCFSEFDHFVGLALIELLTRSESSQFRKSCEWIWTCFGFVRSSLCFYPFWCLEGVFCLLGISSYWINFGSSFCKLCLGLLCSIFLCKM